jgi:hypothetical protein
MPRFIETKATRKPMYVLVGKAVIYSTKMLVEWQMAMTLQERRSRMRELVAGTLHASQEVMA